MFEWWEFKLAPLLAICYATLQFSQTSLATTWQLPLYLLLSLAFGATYVSVINDLTDIETDRLAGKANRFADKSIFFKLSILSVCLLFGISTIYLWTTLNLFAGIFYTAAWISYTLYSVPPFRFKTRSILGVFGDAMGAHFFPYLFVVSATFAWVNQPLDFIWLGLVGIWSLAGGIRGILWHQVQDYSSDKNSQVTTFVTKYSKSLACFLGERIIFPFEFLAFTGIIFYSQNLPAGILLILYFALVWSRSVVWDINIVIVAPHPKYQIIMNDFYSALYPFSVLILAVFAHPADLIVGLIHFILFPKTLLFTFQDIVLVIIDAIKQNRNHIYSE